METSALARIAVSLTLALLAGCSCCQAPPPQRATYVVDEATATRVNQGFTGGASDPWACRQECSLRAGYTDAGPGDANLPDAGAAHPTLPVLGCSAGSTGASWLLTCDFAAPCEV